MVKKKIEVKKPKPIAVNDINNWVNESPNLPDKLSDKSSDPLMRYTFDLRKSLHRKLKIYSATVNVPMSVLLQRCVENMIREISSGETQG